MYILFKIASYLLKIAEKIDEYKEEFIKYESMGKNNFNKDVGKTITMARNVDIPRGFFILKKLYKILNFLVKQSNIQKQDFIKWF
jgi:hypothetical protein